MALWEKRLNEKVDLNSTSKKWVFYREKRYREKRSADLGERLDTLERLVKVGRSQLERELVVLSSREDHTLFVLLGLLLCLF